MSLQHNEQNIESVKHGEDELAKIYVGEDLVFEHDKPVWFTRVYKAAKFSLDGYTYNTLASWSSGAYYKSCYANKRFWFGQDRSTAIGSYLTSDVAKGVANWKNYYPGVTTGVWYLDSNGEKIIVCSSANSNDGKLHYTLDGGETWKNGPNCVNPDTTGDIRYVGDNIFWIEKHTGGDDTFGNKVYYWSASTPSTWYSTTFQPAAALGSDWHVHDVWRCNSPDNNKKYYITIRKRGSSSYKTYVCSNFTGNNAVEINFNSLAYPVYFDNKYYCINSGNLFVSNDGQTFSQVTLTGETKVNAIYKMNNKLCYHNDSWHFGVINSDYTVNYTSFSSSEAGTTGYGDNYRLSSNRFPKL